jgi:exodeoxyribonuclease-1
MSRRQETILWHDYETTGTDPRRDRPMVFAASRTTLDLEPLDDPVVIQIQLADDVVPSIEACLVTGLVPDREGAIRELEAARKILALMSVEQTCVAGFNSVRFDDEVTRFLLWRNLLPVYEREMRNGNSRMDIIDMLRAACALRPAGMEWPELEPGVPTFRLEELAKANGIVYAAHDAAEDVRATIELARKLRAAQPRLWNDLLECRFRREVRARLDHYGSEPFVHVSRRFPAAQHCTSLMLHVVENPRLRNLQICLDLRHDPQTILDLTVEELRVALFTPHAERSPDLPRVGLKAIHLGRFPVMAPRAVLDDASIARIGLDMAACERHVATAKANMREIVRKATELYDDEPMPADDVDVKLYDGFVEDADRHVCDEIHGSPPQSWRSFESSFDDERLGELLFRMRARNHPETLGLTDHERWREHCRARLDEPGSVQLARIDELRRAGEAPSAILDAVAEAIRVRRAKCGL